VSAPALRLTPQRRAVLDVVAEAQDHPTAAQVLDRVRDRVEGVGAATVYRTLALLVESGQVAELRVGEGQALRYDQNVHSHAHLVCTACGQVQDAHVQLDAVALAKLMKKTSFTITGFDIQLHGRCARCAAQDNAKESAQ
jgi:Fur family ferric uptake transcriptional regulator/Fur family peroxide stress response transcriptional regulator